jgi:hypothetical protein
MGGQGDGECVRGQQGGAQLRDLEGERGRRVKDDLTARIVLLAK